LGFPTWGKYNVETGKNVKQQHTPYHLLLTVIVNIFPMTINYKKFADFFNHFIFVSM